MAFYKNASLEGSLVIPDGVTQIGRYAFAGCGFDGTLTLPDSVTGIGQNAFGQNSFTGDLCLPKTLEVIERETFRNAGFDGTLTLPDSLEPIEAYAFSGCGFGGSLTLPASVRHIGTAAFSDCSGLAELVFHEGLEAVGDEAFIGCRGLAGTLMLPESLRVIGARAFRSCVSLEGELVLPAAMKAVSDEAFAYSGITAVTFPAALQAIGEKAFAETALQGKLRLPEELVVVSPGAFMACEGLTGVSGGRRLRSVAEDAFALTDVTTSSLKVKPYDPDEALTAESEAGTAGGSAASDSGNGTAGIEIYDWTTELYDDYRGIYDLADVSLTFESGRVSVSVNGEDTGNSAAYAADPYDDERIVSFDEPLVLPDLGVTRLRLAVSGEGARLLYGTADGGDGETITVIFGTTEGSPEYAAYLAGILPES